MTEPEVAGADPTQLRTTAVLDGDEWVINGHKWFTSGAEGAAFTTVMAVTEPDAPPHLRMSQIIVPTDTPGLRLIRADPGDGARRRGWRRTARCATRTCACRRQPPRRAGRRVPDRAEAARAGPHLPLHALARPGAAGVRADVRTRSSARRSAALLAEKQTIQNLIAESAAEIQACRLLTLDAAAQIDAGGEARVEIWLIKFYGARMLHNVIDRAIQVHGARGVTDDTPLDKMYGRRAPPGSTTDPTRSTTWSSAAASSRSSGTAARTRSASRARSRSRAQLLGLEAVRPGLSLEAPAVASDQVEPVGPAAVGECHRVVDVVQQDRDSRLQSYRARSGGLPPARRARSDRRRRSPGAGCRRAPSRLPDAPRGCRR